ncbi:hypothetical protein BACCOPRO_01928 [Phocaeicola coprophilus DSM 18228 = JCM 13818]|uniref:Uncharacterized protein n=1 Tax=Phocaeicola coprophilus DSM 18228 = JCM 13818 TaxID=547042 RepID=S0F7N8_9BACT|nr:hypothetical protein BACCOPRO_01928 [Phocaeicola coprophilus DSM 18228 = JCM 13818]
MVHSPKKQVHIPAAVRLCDKTFIITDTHEKTSVTLLILCLPHPVVCCVQRLYAGRR